MEIPELTPQRQKMLMGAAAAGLLLLVGFSFAPSLEVAEEPSDEMDDVLALVELDREPRTMRSEPVDAPRPLHRPRLAITPDDSPKNASRVRENPETVSEEPKPAEAMVAHVVPPAYQRRLELLAEEEAALVRQQRRRGESGAAEPMPTVTVASVEADESESTDVEHALAEARRPGRFRRVELIEGSEGLSAGLGDSPRGAWLSGSIESD